MVRQWKVFQDNMKVGSTDQTGKRTDRWFDRSRYVDGSCSSWLQRHQRQSVNDKMTTKLREMGTICQGVAVRRWLLQQKKVNKSIKPYTTLEGLRRFLIRKWQGIDQVQIRGLIGSMRRRLLGVQDSDGGHTKNWGQDISSFKVKDTAINFMVK